MLVRSAALRLRQPVSQTSYKAYLPPHLCLKALAFSTATTLQIITTTRTMSPVPLNEDNKYAPSSTSATAYRRFGLPDTVTPGILNIPSANGADAKKVVEELLEKDREYHHCFFNPAQFHNHLSHHLLAAYDMGASGDLLKAIYEDEARGLLPIDVVLDSATKEAKGQFDVKRDDVTIDASNWKKYLGNQKRYASFLSFFTTEIKNHGVAGTLEKYVFSEEARGEGAHMQWRLVGGVFHPLIQVGYALEFGSDAMVAQALAQTALHRVNLPDALLPSPPTTQQSTYTPLLQILRKVYDSDTLKPVMPYDPNVTINQRYKDLYTDGRPEEIQRLCSLWWSKPTSAGVSDSEIAAKIEELVWLSALIFGAVSKKDRKPRLDFFLMHILNMTIFLPSYAKVLSRKDMTILLQSVLPIVISTLIMRGRPRVDLELVMSYTTNPLPHVLRGDQSEDDAHPSSTPDAILAAATNPWLRIAQDVIHAPDAHTIKAIRALYFGSRAYAHNAPAGHVVGSYVANHEETLAGTSKLDGSVFLRIAGVVMETMGWVTYGEPAGSWDRSALGWDDAWKNE